MTRFFRVPERPITWERTRRVVSRAAIGIVRRPVLQKRLNQNFRAKERVETQIRVRSAPDIPGFHNVRLRRSGRATQVCFDYGRVLWRYDILKSISDRLPTMISYFLAARNTREILVDVSDGEEGGAGWVSFDSRVDGSILVADFEFYGSQGYDAFRQAARDGARWDERSGTIVWRGSTTGADRPMTNETMSAGDTHLLPRTRMCLLLRDQPDADVRFSNVVQSRDPEDAARLAAARLLGESIEPFSWRDRKFALAVDGNCSPWSNLFTRLLLGCCVIRIASWQGWRQWYYADLKPWEHYVPVAADQSDLLERVEWCRTHLSECREIAARGQEFAMRRTFDSEVRLSVDRIEAAFALRQG